MIFVQELIDNKEKMTEAIYKSIQNLGADSIKNLEFAQRWAVVGLNLKNGRGVDQASTIVSTTGRLLYLTPLYQALMDNGYDKAAKNLYTQNENFYSPLARGAIKSIIGVKLNHKEVMALSSIKAKNYRRIKW